MNAATYHRARRDYQFSLEPSHDGRCISCASCGIEVSGAIECRRIDIAIADPARSVCELYTAKESAQ